MSCTWGCTSTPSMSLNVSLTSLITFSAFTFPLRSSSCRLAVVQEAKIIEKEIDGEREQKLNEYNKKMHCAISPSLETSNLNIISN